jgi:hypothetical protein
MLHFAERYGSLRGVQDAHVDHVAIGFCIALVAKFVPAKTAATTTEVSAAAVEHDLAQ